MRTVIQIILAIVIVFLGYTLINNINKPIRFQEEVTKREQAIIARLIDIRKAQEAFKEKYGKYTGSFDTLINFIKTDSFEIPRKDYLPGWDPDLYTEEQGIKKGLIKITITKKSVLDSLYGKNYNVDELRYVPYTNGYQFTMAAGELMSSSGIKVKVFEAYALYDSILKDLDPQLVTNYIYNKEKIMKFPGLKVGSLKEFTNNAGNWEK